MDNKILSEIGLTPGEIKTYLALLKLGSSSTGPIAKESGVSRSKLYSILDKLEKKGLVSFVDKKGVTYFQASDPVKIKDYMKEKQENLEKLKNKFESFLPELESYKDSKTSQKVSIYTGFKGLITVHEHTYQKLGKGETYYYMGIPKEQPQTHHLYWQRDHLRRIKSGIKCQFLFDADTPKEILKNRNKYKNCDARYMPININTPTYFLIYKDTVAITIPSENPISIEIISQEIADSFKAYFEEFWGKSKRLK
jgi:sugar-specific transcriptional regulator TrmB